MREILFRGKSAENGSWYVGNLSTSFINKPIGNTIVHKIQEFNYSYADENEIEPISMSGFDEIVVPETVGQYTGLTDKNGNKIFEGDIVEYEHTLTGYYQLEIGEDYKPRRSHSCYWNEDKTKFHYKRNYAVEWKGKDARLILRNGSDQHDLRQTSLIIHNGTIIGNIHDNPELLKGSAE